MSYRRRLVSTLAAHSIAITALSAAAASGFIAGLVALPLAFMLIVIAVGFSLYRHVIANTIAVREFLSAATHADVGRRFVDAGSPHDPELAKAFEAVLDRLGSERRESAAAAHRLDLLMRHVPIPLIVLAEDQQVRYSNQAARQFFEISNITTANQIDTVAPELPAIIRSVPAGRAIVSTVMIRGQPIDLRVRTSEMRIEGAVERIVTLENLSPELADREANAWRDLTRVLSHEIMNTLTPVTSLAETSRTLMGDRARADDVDAALETIGRRSRGLIDFVSSYRTVSRPPVPKRSRFVLAEAAAEVTQLIPDSCTVEIRVDPPTLSLDADRALVEQVLINLARNAEEAGATRIEIVARLERGHTVIEVSDDGPGIDDETAESMFIPFFTTKVDGSGIGLAVARQVMAAHGGTINHVHPPKGGARFVLVF